MTAERLPVGELRLLAPPLAAFSLITNLSVLVSPLFMMQMIDRVLPSGNLNTLFLLLLVAVGALVLNAVVEHGRDVALGRASRWLESIGADAALASDGRDGSPRMEDVVGLRDFLAGPGAGALLNAPYLPLYFLALAALHPTFALLAAVWVAALLALNWIINFLNHRHEAEAGHCAAEARHIATVMDRYANTASAMSLGTHLRARFTAFTEQRHAAENVAEANETVSRSAAGFVRVFGQISALSLGAALVIFGELSAGAMIGASIISSKALQTGEGLMAALPDIRNAKASYDRLEAAVVPAQSANTVASNFTGRLRAETLIFPRGGGAPPRLDRVSFELKPAECLAIVGDSGSAKTTLLHVLCGAEICPIGAVFLDDTDIRSLSRATRDQIIGYMPQHAVLLHGTIAENICCFAPDPDPDRIIDAAREAGVHGLISALPKGYDTDLGANPHLISAGQTQRLALARAVYSRPRYVFMDEPNALLDANGERQLFDAIRRLKEGGATIVMVVHRSGILKLADKVMRLDAGRIVDFGSAKETLARIGDRRRWIRMGVHDGAQQDLSDWCGRQFNRASDAAFLERTRKVVTGLHAFLAAAGPKNRAREIMFHFQFYDTSTASITVSEDVAVRLGGKFKKVKDFLKKPGRQLNDLPEDERALAVVLEEAEDLDAQVGERACNFIATFKHPNPDPTRTDDAVGSDEGEADQVEGA